MLLSKAEIKAVDKSCAVAGVVTCDEMLLSRHHFTVKNEILPRQLFQVPKVILDRES